ncbi:MAG TPA: hypothetical protein VMR86_05205 [Myxococcota bacterium]|nr:hypothetical protein [Myxococcota bacterium]
MRLRALKLGAWLLAVLLAGDARSAGLGFVYVSANVGLASGGHGALVAGDTVYHLQNSPEGLLLLVREGWSSFHTVYAELENRPLVVARLDAAPEVTGQVEAAFARLYVAQEIALARRDSLREDVAWLEAAASGRPAPPLRGLGLVDPQSPGDPDALRLRAQAGDDAVAALRADAEREVESLSAVPEPGRLETLREALTLREAARALDAGDALDPAALAALPAEVDSPLSADERAGLEALAQRMAETVRELVASKRHDRGYALLLAQARALAARRSLAIGRLAVLDAFSGTPDVSLATDASDSVRAKWREQAAGLLRRARQEVLAKGVVDEADWNLVEEVAAINARDGRADAAGQLSEFGRRKLPARARAVPTPPLVGDVGAALAAARARLTAAEAELERRWAYDLVHHNCMTELGRTTDTAFSTPEEEVRALGGVTQPEGRALGFVPFVFFDRVRESLRVRELAYFPSHRERELERVLEASPGLATRARESLAYTSSIYTPLPRDSAFLLFTDDVFWRRPVYGGVNLLFALGYTGYGVAALPFDGGVRAKAGLEGMLWSLPELGFVNVRKGSFDWAGE